MKPTKATKRTNRVSIRTSLGIATKSGGVDWLVASEKTPRDNHVLESVKDVLDSGGEAFDLHVEVKYQSEDQSFFAEPTVMVQVILEPTGLRAETIERAVESLQQVHQDLQS